MSRYKFHLLPSESAHSNYLFSVSLSEVLITSCCCLAPVYGSMDLERFACGPSNGSKCTSKYTSRRGLSHHQTICKYYKLQQDILAAKRKERAKATVRKKVMFQL